MSAEDSWNERFICTEFLFSKNRQYKAVDLNFHERQHVEKYPVIDVIKCNQLIVIKSNWITNLEFIMIIVFAILVLEILMQI